MITSFDKSGCQCVRSCPKLSKILKHFPKEWRDAAEFTGLMTSLTLPGSLDAIFQGHQQWIDVLEAFEFGLVDSVDN